MPNMSSESPHINENKRELDIVVYGATSFVGKLTALYINEFVSEINCSEGGAKIKWAIAGRNSNKLDKLKKEIGNESLPILIADSTDSDSLDAMTSKTKVIISTVGPYLKFGESLIKYCVNNGTDYVDLTGETLFIKDMMDKYQETAKKSGARIVNSCGFDSIPSDLGVLFTQDCAFINWGDRCDTINMRVKAAKGGLSGGTIASMATIFEEVGKDKSRRKQLANPYLLNDDANAPKIQQTDIKRPKWDFQNERWLAPFVMASINTRIVHRSNQLLGYEYGRDFKYDEAMWMPSGMKGRIMSYGMAAGLAGFAGSMAFKPSRELLNEYVLPKSGSGPSKTEREKGYFDIRFIGFTTEHHQIRTKVTGKRDPGYGSTCRMLAQSAICLLQDVPKSNIKGGFWTPASAMGDKLIERLQKYAGITFEEVATP